MERLPEKENKAERVTQCGRNALPETVTRQKTAAQAPGKKTEVAWETNE